MGGKSKSEQRGSSSTQYEQNPWENSIHGLDEGIAQLRTSLSQTGLTGNETSALDRLYALAQEGNPYSQGIGNLASDLLSGGKDRTGLVQSSYDDFKRSMTPYTTMETDPYKNAAFTKATGYMTDDITNRIKSQYAGAGYSPVATGDFGKQMGEGISRGIAPTWLDAYDKLENRKLGAITGLFGAGNTTAGLLHGMDQAALGNRYKGIDASRAALTARDSPYIRQLEIEAQRRGIPADRLQQIMSQLIATGQLGGSGTSNTQNFQSKSSTESWTDSLAKITSSISNLFGSSGAFGKGAAGGAWGGFGG